MVELIILAVSVLTSLLVGSVVVAQNTRSATNLTYGLLTLCFVGLCVVNFMTIHPSEQLLAYIRLTIFFTSLSVYSVYLLAARIQHHVSARFVTSPGLRKVVLLGTLLVAGLNLSPYVFSGLSDAGNSPVPGPGVGVFIGQFVIVLVLTLWMLFAGMRHDTPRRERDQLRLILLAIIPILILAPLTAFLLPVVFGLTGTIMLTPLYIAYFVTMIGYAVVKHGLFDVRLAAVRSAAYALSLASLSFIYYLLAYVVSATFFQGNMNTSVSISPVNIALALLLAFVFQPIKSFFDTVTNNIFFRDQYNTEEFYARFSSTLTSTTDLRTLLERASHEISSTLKAEQASFYVYHDDRMHHISAGTQNRPHLAHDDVKSIDEYARSHNAEIIVTQMVESRSVARVLTHYKISMLLPLLRNNDIVGYLALGERLSGSYSRRDVNVLMTISDELIIAIQNTLSVQLVREANALLENRVDQATKELRASNVQLRRLDETKDEFISMASHQLRTPLTSVKGYISMMLDGDVGPITEQQEKVLLQAFESSQRMVFLIGDFLNVSRIQTGKFMLEPTEFDVATLVSEEVEQLRDTAKARGLELVYHAPKNIPPIMADKTKLRQVMMNFLDNAIFYSPNGGKITVQLYKDVDAIVYKVVDCGIGVPKDEQAKLFTKFFRAGNARRQRPDGTGVGIYMAKKVVVSHGGTILFESTEGKGSMFGFRLPLENSASKLDKQPANHHDHATGDRT